MRKLLLSMGIVAAVLVPAGGADAGTPGSETVLTVVKAVEGDGPAGTQFTVRISCPNGNPVQTIDFTYPATGGTQTTLVPGTYPQMCSITETATGGADPVTYQCAVVEIGAATNDPATCLSNTEFQTGVDAEITLTVTNTFLAPPDPAAAAPPPAPVVAAAPVFTG